MKRIAIIWGNWGPYHYARFKALFEEGEKRGIEVHGVELFATSGYYDWTVSTGHPAVHHLDIGDTEMEFNPVLLCRHLLPLLIRIRADVLFVPSYWHWSLFANLAGRICRGKIVMMNESHAATQQATGWKKALKKQIVRRFHGALVGGSPHIRHFANLGLDESRIFVGYDAVDNDYFSRRSRKIRQDPETIRAELELPENYFLNLGRMVAKKNLTTLIRAFALFLKNHPDTRHHLVMVGSGEEEEGLRQLCEQLKLPVVNRTHIRTRAGNRTLATVGPSDQDREEEEIPDRPAVHFYGFRQIEENPAFYALATAFVLPSSKEEWGLVVNEAMACSLPVIVAREVGCAENLVISGQNGYTFNPASPEELARLLGKIQDPDRAARMGGQSLKIIEHWGCERFASGAIQAAGIAVSRPELVEIPSPLSQ